MKVIITAGPTREYIDDMRFITNPSSGKTGQAIALEAVSRDYDTYVVLGPVKIKMPDKAHLTEVVSAGEMTAATLKLLDGADLLICVAAIADFTPELKAQGKMRSGRNLVLKLKPTPKLIKLARERFPNLKIIAFKAEYNQSKEDLLAAGRSLLEIANMVVVNDISSGIFGSDKTSAFIVSDDVEHIGSCTKRELAKKILDRMELLWC